MALTKRTIDATKPPASGETALWDEAIPGFCVRVRASGAKLYYLKARVRGRIRWFAIGRHGAPWTVEMARREAKRLLGEIVANRDPAEARDSEKADLTVSELCDDYLKAAAAGVVMTRFGVPKKPAALAIDRGRIERHIKPLIGRRRVRDVTRRDVERLLFAVAEGATRADVKTGPHGRAIVEGGKGTARRTVELLGGIFTYAVKRGLREDNPVRGVALFQVGRRQRFLSSAELLRLGEALDLAQAEGEHPSAIAAVRLLLLTGCRKSEILTAQWPDVDFERGMLFLRDSKTGARPVALGAAALEVIAGLPRLAGNPYLLPGEREGRHFIGLPATWNRIRGRAGLPDVRLHDLRHSFASVAAAAGDSLIVIGRLLGHKVPATTQRYAHLADSPLRASADRTAGTIAAALAGKPGNVVALRPKAV